MAFPPEVSEYSRPDGSVVVPARVAGSMIRLLTIGVVEGRRHRVPVNSDMVRVLDALQEAAAAADAGSSGAGTTAVGGVTLDARQQYLTTAEAAVVCGCTPRAIVKAIGQGRLRAEQHGHLWLIGTADLDTYRFGRSSA